MHAQEERSLMKCWVTCHDDAEERPGGLTGFIGYNGENSFNEELREKPGLRVQD